MSSFYEKVYTQYMSDPKKAALLTALVTNIAAANAVGNSLYTRQGQELGSDELEKWLDNYFGKFKAAAEALGDGANFQEALDFIGLVVRAAQDLGEVLAGMDRARIVVIVVTWLLNEFLPPDLYWLRMLVADQTFLTGLVEMVFKAIFPK